MTTKLAFLSDAGFLRPTLVAMASALEHATAPVEVHFVGWNFAGSDWDMVKTVAAAWPDHRLFCHDLPEEWLIGSTSPKTTIPRNALGKLFLNRLIPGRFLYVDGDVLVHRDLSQAMTLDIGDALMAGVPDYLASRRAAEGGEKGAWLTDLLSGAPGVTYVNSGVLLIEGDKISADPALMAQMADMEAAQGFGTVDQDRINQIFAHRMAILDPAWNSSWGRMKAHRARIAAAGGKVLARPADGKAFVLHFHGPGKPWKKMSFKDFNKGPLAVLTYRRYLKSFGRRFPDLLP